VFCYRCKATNHPRAYMKLGEPTEDAQPRQSSRRTPSRTYGKKHSPDWDIRSPVDPRLLRKDCGNHKRRKR